jgi:hypothetical protein
MRKVTREKGLALAELLGDPKNLVLPCRRTEPTPCPHCGAPNNRASTETGELPNAGDFYICIHCAGLGEYDADLRVVKLDPQNIEDPAERKQAEDAMARARDASRAVFFTPEGDA